LRGPTSTASYLALTELLVGRPHDLRTVRLVADVEGITGKTYPAGTDVRVSGTGPTVIGFFDGDLLSLGEWDYAELDGWPKLRLVT
jgi:hypothetical protein